MAARFFSRSASEPCVLESWAASCSRDAFSSSREMRMSSTMSALIAGALAADRGAAVSSCVCVGSAFSQRVSARRLSNRKSHIIRSRVLFMAAEASDGGGELVHLHDQLALVGADMADLHECHAHDAKEIGGI